MTVVIVNWNTRDLLRRCLDALAPSQASVAVEVVVVDNGSDDGSLEGLASRYPGLKIIANPSNRGFSAANNQGVAEASGRYVLLLNSDTEPRPACLETLAGYADSHPGGGVFGPQLLNPDGTLQPSGGLFPTPWSTVAHLFALDRLSGRARYGTNRDYSMPAEVDEVSGAAMLVRTELIRALGGLDEEFEWGYEDIDLCRRAQDAGWSVHYVAAAKVVHLWGASKSLAPTSAVLKAIAGRRHYFRKHFGLPATALVLTATVASHALRALYFLAAGGRSPAGRHRAAVEWAIATGVIGRAR